MEKQFYIRNISPNDVSQVFELLVEFSHYERIEKCLTLTKENLGQQFFGAGADWNALVAATSEEEILGICLYTLTNTNREFNPGPVIYIDDMYIRPLHRRRGIGEQLIQALEKEARDKDIPRIELWCLKSNEAGQAFYKKLGWNKLENIDVFRLNLRKPT